MSWRASKTTRVGRPSKWSWIGSSPSTVDLSQQPLAVDLDLEVGHEAVGHALLGHRQLEVPAAAPDLVDLDRRNGLAADRSRSSHCRTNGASALPDTSSAAIDELDGRHFLAAEAVVDGRHDVEEDLVAEQQPQLVEGKGALDPRQQVGPVAIVGAVGIDGRQDRLRATPCRDSAPREPPDRRPAVRRPPRDLRPRVRRASASTPRWR